MSHWTSHRRRGSWSADRSAHAAPRTAGDRLLHVVDACLAGVIFVAPLVLGGRHDLGRLVFIGLVAVGSTAWFARQALAGERTAPHWAARLVFALAALLLIVQLLPLPAPWLARIAPRTAELLPLWTGAHEAGELGAWRTLSLTPPTTRLSLAMLAAYALLFFTVLGRVRGHADAARLVRWVGLSAGLMAGVGLLQFVAPNGKYLWIYEHPSRDASDRLSGPFANRNHFAHFLALGAPVLAAWLALRLQASPSQVRSAARRSNSLMHDRETLLAGGLLALVAATAVLSCSRGGVLALAISCGVVLACLNRLGLLGGRRAAVLAAVGAAVFVAVSFTGYDRIADRLSSLTAQSLDELDESAGRRKIWQANVAAIREGGWFGAGAGSHAKIYPIYLADPPAKQYTHAESGYLQVVTENGVPGAVLLVIALSVAAGACVRALRRAATPEAKACAAAATAALAASAVHSLCDFVWYIPACLSVTLVLVACAMRLGDLAATPIVAAPASAHARRTAFAHAVAVALAGVWALAEFVGPAAAALHRDAYLRMSNAHRDFTYNLLAIPPGEAARVLAESHQAQQASLEAMIAQLDAVVRSYPACAPAHNALASRCLQLFNLKQQQADNPMPASQIAGAAIASHFRSSAELREWLDRAVGLNARWLDRALVHARAAVQLSPLEGEAYATLAEVCFLRGEGIAEADAYLGQAARIRPYDGDLLTEIGVQWMSRGVAEPALACWAQAFRVAGPHRIQVARCLAGQFPIDWILDQFAPAWDTLPEFWRVARGAQPAEVETLLTYAEAQAARETPALTPVRAGVVWRSLAQMETDAARPDRALAVLEHANRAYPQDYATRRMHAFALADAGRFADAAPHLQWCLARRPDDQGVAAALARAGRERLAARPH